MPSWLTGARDKAFRIISIYSRVRARGDSKGTPCQLSTTALPLLPNPKMARPLDKISNEPMVWAMSAGVLLYTLMMPVARRMFSVWQAIIVKTVKASRPQDSAAQKEW